MKLLPMDLSSQLINIPVNFLVDIVPSAALADQPVVPTASTSQRREMALKQVNHLISIFHTTNT